MAKGVETGIVTVGVPHAECPAGYLSGPCYWELVAIVVAGLLHVVVETGFSATTARLYNVGIAIVAVAYLVWRIRRTDGVLRTWGLRRDNFWPALRAQLSFGVVGAAVLFGFAAVTDAGTLPSTFWIATALYPIWGTAQQFALQNFIARNLAGLLPNPGAIALAASALFGAAHYPRLDLVVLALVAGFFFTLIYRRFPNLWAVGIVHGMLGGLAMYIVLDEDPGAVILDVLTGG